MNSNPDPNRRLVGIKLSVPLFNLEYFILGPMLEILKPALKIPSKFLYDLESDS